jgi:3-oxoacyl-[acyl-carrier protein] reductase
VNQFPLRGKTAIVTGANRGIGRAIATRLARDGAAVVLCARDRDRLHEAVREIEQSGGAALAVSLDLRLRESAAALIDAALGQFGRIDIVVNNAGATKRGEFLDLTEQDWTDGFALKFFGAVRLSRVAWPELRRQSGSVVNIAGIGGRTPGPQFTIGGSVNAALLSFTKALADLGVGDGVQVNAINPGSIRTERLERRIEDEAARLGVDRESAARILLRDSKTTRFGEPADIANLVAFIVSSEGRFLHGSLIDMDGGAAKSL